MSRANVATYRIAGLAICSLLMFGCDGGGNAPTPLGTDASLSSLSVTGASLDPAFSPAVTNYTATVPNSSDSVDVSATTSDNNASFTINGSTNATIALAVGVNTISIVVTAEDGTTTRTYTIVVTRDAAPPPPPPPGPIDNSVAYSTFIGMGVSGAQGGANSVVVDDAGNVYVAGFAFTTDFGATPGAFQTMYGGGFSDGFVAKFTSDGALIYLTFLGGNDEDDATDIAIDDVGNVYVVGTTWSSNFPTAAPFQANQPGRPSVFAAKLDSNGSSLIYSTYLGGTGQDNDAAVAVGSAGSAYVAGGTFSTDFPITPGSFQQVQQGGRDVFVAKLDSDGSLVYSTFVGGSDTDGQGNDIAVDATGHAYVITESFSTDFPTTPGAYQPAFGGGPSDVAVFKVAPAGDTLVYSTYLGGSDFEQTGGPSGIAVDGIGSGYVIGSTASFDFPVTAGAFQTTMQDQPSSSTNQALDIFVTKLNPAGDDLVFSTYIGGATSADTGHDIAIDGDGNSYITGHTFSTDFPTVNALENVSGTGHEVIAAKLNANGSALAFSSVIGGLGADFGESLDVDIQGNMLIVGSTLSSDYPITNAVQSDCGFPCQNGMITKIVDIPNAP